MYAASGEMFENMLHKISLIVVMFVYSGCYRDDELPVAGGGGGWRRHLGWRPDVRGAVFLRMTVSRDGLACMWYVRRFGMGLRSNKIIHAN